MINIIVTSYNEPEATLKAVKQLLNENIKTKFKIILADPFTEVKKYLEKHIKDKRFEFFLDPGEGKAQTLNILLKKFYSKNKNDLLVFTDGDVFIKKNSIVELIKGFKNPKVGCITGKPVSIDYRKGKYGYWSKFLYTGIDMVRKKLSKESKFFQCSGYLFAIRNGILKEVPLDVPEDCIIPYLIWKKGYFIKYAEKAIIYVKYPSNWKDWLNQKVRTIKAHENISKLYPGMPRTKSLLNEFKEGWFFLFTYPKSIKEFFWTLSLYFARLYIYYLAFKQSKKDAFDPGWREVEIKSTNPFPA